MGVAIDYSGREGVAGEDATVALKRSDTIDLIKEKLGLGKSKAYELFNAAVAAGVMRTNDKKHYFLKQS